MTNDSLRRWLALLPSTFITAVIASSTFTACKSTKSSKPDNSEKGAVAAAPDQKSGEAVIVLGGANSPDSAKAAAPSGQDPGFQGAVDEARVRQERQQYLVVEFMKKGVDAYNHLDFASARSAFASAVELDPTNKQASEWLGKTLAALGENSAVRAGDIQDKAQEQIVRQAQARQTVNQSILDGDRLLEQRKFDESIDSYRRAERILAWFPLLETEGSLRKTVANKIDFALGRKDASTREDAEARQRKASADRELRESQARDQLVNKLRKLYSDANVAFLEQRHEVAIDKLNQLLEIDPMNERAVELRDIVQSAKDQSAMDSARKEYKKRWTLAFRELDHLLTPQTDTIVHDPLHWKEIADRQPLQFKPAEVQVNPEDEAVKDRLKSTLFEPKFANTSIQEIATYLNNLTQVNFILSPKILEQDEGQRAVTLDLPPKTSVEKFLQALQVVKNYNYRIVDGYVRLATADENKGNTEYRIYDVSDIIQIVKHFPGQEISLLAPGAPAIPAGTEPEAQPAFTLEQIAQIIQNSIAPATWTDAEAKTALRYVQTSGTLVVRQTPEVHAQVEKLLSDLRETTNLLVEVQTRFLIAEDTFLEDIGFDWRGLGDGGNSVQAPSQGLGAAQPFDDFGANPAPGTSALPGPLGTGTSPGYSSSSGGTDVLSKTENIFDQNLTGSAQQNLKNSDSNLATGSVLEQNILNRDVITGSGGLTMQWINLGDRQSELILRAVEKSERVELVTAPRLLIRSGERANLMVTNQYAYVSGYGVEIAQASAIADPIIDVVTDGAILDVRPVVSGDRKFVKLEVRPTLATLKRPIEKLVVGLGNGTPVTIEFPNLTIRKVRTTVVVPDGSSLLLGGQSIDELRDSSAGVPVLRDLPLIGFFFDRKGQYSSKRRLVILLNVKIVIPTEAEPRLPVSPDPLLQKQVTLNSR